MKSKINLIVLFGALAGALVFPGHAYALTNITAAGVNGSGGFPVALSSAGATYQLTEDISCSTTCFTIKADNITLDLNGHTATFGSVNNPGLFNTGMENWVDNNTLSNWTVLSGTVTQRTAQVWGSYDAELSATASIKSDPVTLNAGQTYDYYAIIKGSSADSYTIRVKRVSDDVVLASTVIAGDLLNRAFAMGDGSLTAAENFYKPSVGVAVYLQIDGAGTFTKRLQVADIKPSRHYFLTSKSYRNTTLYPDLADSLFGGSSAGLIIKNGTITQGAGGAVKSVAIYASSISNINNVNINMSGNNSSWIAPISGTFTIDTVNADTASILNFNRMHPAVGIDFIHSGGVSEIKNCTLLNDPEQSMRELNTWASLTDTGSIKIYNNVIRGKEQVTEGYAIVLSGGNVNVEIYNNDINPYLGRGILLDSVAGRTGYIDSNKNVSIHDNTIRNIYEHITSEYGATMLEAAGIRVRDWGGADEGHRGLKIYNNNISVYADALGTHRSYGINITSSASQTSAEIYDNTMSAVLNSSGGSDWETDCIALQNADMSSGGSIKIHNNVCTGNVGFRLGGNDGFNVKNVEIYSNDVSTNEASILYYGSNSPTFTNNVFYCNKLTGTSGGFPLFFEDVIQARTMGSQYFSNNLLTGSSSYEVRLTNNYTSSVTSCGNGVLDISGGGLLGSATDPCHDGVSGCWATAGLTSPDFVAPASPSGLSVM